MRATACLLGTVAGLAAAAAVAGTADVVGARAVCRGDTCTVFASVRHADEGWSHYADRFEVLAPGGEILGTRVLQHPHVDEQPFTRALRGVRVPPGVERLRIRAGDSVHGLGGASVEIDVERSEVGAGDAGPDRDESRE